tara:strand:+ start:1894 stop:2709 length:816 start_codon:yes stop_codon:yes gene_type:complete
MDNIKAYASKLIDFFDKRYKLKVRPKITFQDDEQNSQNPLARTAQYDPRAKSIVVFVTGRHIKDCLRSLAHELVHHMQCERGDLDNIGPTVAGYAQKDDHMREMEREAYEKGNMCFRDFEDQLKESGGLKQLNETNYFRQKDKGDVTMSTKNWKNKELNTLLMEQWGYKSKDGENKLLKENIDQLQQHTNGYAGVTRWLAEEEDLSEEELAERLLEDGEDALDTRSANAPVYNVGQVQEEGLRRSIRKMIKSNLQEQKLRKTIRTIIGKIL